MGIFKFFLKKYWVFLFCVVLATYGQTLWMQVWRDANAIFFKFSHLNEPAGYLGVGLLGSGTYKFSVTPYWFVYQLVGYKLIWPYYFLNLIFYFFATFLVYRLFSKVLSQKAGRVAGFLFAAGYIASEGFFSLDSSMILNVSVILIALTLIFYAELKRPAKSIYYLLALFFYFLASFLTPVRVHYFITVIAVFDVLWIWKFDLRKSYSFVLRMLPFLVVFYFYFIKNADSRTFLIIPFVKDIAAGKLFNLYSTFGSLGYMFLPDKQLNWLANVFYVKWLITGAIGVCLLVCFKGKRFVNRIVLFYLVFSLVWILVANVICSYPQLSVSIQSNLAVFVGGEGCLFLLTVLFLVGRKMRLKIIFLSVWLAASLITYTSYEPTNIYGTVERYLGHSFLPLVGFLALAVETYPRKKIFYFLVLVWGVANVYNSVIYEHMVLAARSLPAKQFYDELRSYVPKLGKGDVLYFDVASDAHGQFDSAFSVGQMPDETAIAWRYGIDRYDIRRVTNYGDLKKLINDGKFGDIHDKDLKINKIYSFLYTNNGLINTTTEVNKYLAGTDYHIGNIGSGIPSYIPTTVRLEIVADSAISVFPMGDAGKIGRNNIYLDDNLQDLAFGYLRFKKNFKQNANVESSSDWRENVSANVLDGNPDTVWRPDRILWHDGKQFLQIDLKVAEKINRLVWVNTYANNSPTHYFIDVSMDGKKWDRVYEVNESRRIESGSLETVDFDPISAKYVRFGMAASLNDDSPGISEMWVVPAEFSGLNIGLAEEYLKFPFLYVSDKGNYQRLLRAVGNRGEARVYWKTDINENWQTDFASRLVITYDKVGREYEVFVPADGTRIVDLKLGDIEIPGEVTVEKIEWKK